MKNLLVKGLGVPGLECYIHLDAAFGGLVAPFLRADRDDLKFDFSLSCGEGSAKKGIVDSIAVDPHKIGMVPYPAGAFLCRKGHQDYVERAVAYISGHSDDTFLGSRPGSAAAACWAVFSHLGRKGYGDIYGEVYGFEKIIESCMELTRYLKDALSRERGVEVIPPEPVINILAAKFDPRVYDPRRLQRIAAKYRVIPELFMRDVADCPQRVYRFTLMPHVQEATIDNFIKDLSEALIHPTS